MAILIAFYSRAGQNYFDGAIRETPVGNTEKAAKIIQDLTNGDLFKIEQKVPYSENYSTCTRQAKADLQNNARPELVSLPENLNDYDEIYLGYPNYWGTMPMAVYTFLEALDWKGKTIHPFCTNEGSGLSSTVKEIRNATKGAIVTEGLSLYGSEVDNSKASIKKWIERK